RSLLAIDLEACVRCGHCAWSCAEAHGSARLERRGEKVKLALRDASGVLAERALLVARACQHCKEPACLVECPTGAILRAADGAVFVREDLCTGCGACAKACPWDAIRMAPRSPEQAGGQGTSALVAVKCDLCHGLEGQACVSACPTGAIVRADPARDLVEVRAVLAGERTAPRAAAARPGLRPIAMAALVPPLVVLARLAHEFREFRFSTGALAGVACAVLALHAVLKRRPRVRAWIARFLPKSERGGLQRAVGFHSLTGMLAMLLVLSHAGLSVPRGAAGALCVAFWLVALSGAFGALVYRALPPRLARLERRGSLPEDRAAERDELRQALFDGVSAQNAAVKELARRVLVPYAGAPGGAVALALSGRSLAEEEAALERRIEALLGGRRSERLGEVAKLVRIAVALRALGARKLLENLLAAWLPVHAAGVVILLALLVLHVAGVSGAFR
ncbi:MAG TPA: 4Fe-4S binding protein, partial [Polyangiaceae bacterium]